MRHALILAGGSGIRLWPVSREKRPKQLIPVIDGKSLLQIAFDRLEGLIPSEQRHVCSALRYKDDVLAALPDLTEYIGEPVGRDTLPAIALSCSLIAKEDPEAVVAVLTSDHIIKPEQEFRKILQTGFDTIELFPDILLTFGVKPDYPATGFGYLELAGPIGSSKSDAVVFRAKHFREKPDFATAQKFLEAGSDRYLWNSGMFMWRAARFLDLLHRYEPELAAGIDRIFESGAFGSKAMDDTMQNIYPSLKKNSIDYGIMERASADPDVCIGVLPLETEWHDVGSWNAYGSLIESDKAGNTFIPVIQNAPSDIPVFIDCKGTLVVSEETDHLVACLGCEDLVIVHTADATLVCPRSRCEELKSLYASIVEKHEKKFM